jgi:hypothetical protein
MSLREGTQYLERLYSVVGGIVEALRLYYQHQVR